MLGHRGVPKTKTCDPGGFPDDLLDEDGILEREDDDSRLDLQWWDGVTLDEITKLGAPTRCLV